MKFFVCLCSSSAGLQPVCDMPCVRGSLPARYEIYDSHHFTLGLSLCAIRINLPHTFHD